MIFAAIVIGVGGAFYWMHQRVVDLENKVNNPPQPPSANTTH